MLSINLLRTCFNNSGVEALFKALVPSVSPTMFFFPEKFSAQSQNNDSKGGQNKMLRPLLSPECQPGCSQGEPKAIPSHLGNG